MSARHIKPLLLLLPFLVAACASGNQKQAIQPEVNQDEISKIQSYAAQIQQAVTAEFSDIKSWRGKECTIRASILQDGMLMKAVAEDGDPEFCEAALAALTRAKLPPAPDEKTWLKFKNSPFYFAP
ncbi:colicin import membrane protein [Enterobacter sp. BIGb0383]|uniref:cell envelope integrity protein TolA n=1 Tax=unclassified Enterobacter TaxID=2608935 RepID=UPI000F499A81|nr:MULTISPECIES: cell envelope integrity protein TolA [unclassified Enterobacter]ROP62946.1 colicin import membrane protein [Enterobacter sp. BIGb0383]ROS13107.1 colicin import membrane protein [Enterobacter sp. BIGb0359]